MQALGVKTNSANMTGLLRVLAIESRFVNRILKPTDSERHVLPIRSIRVKEGGVMFPLVTVAGLAFFAENIVDGQNGKYYAHQVDIFLPGDSREVRSILDSNHDTTYILAILDSQNIAYLIGSKESPCKLSHPFSNSGNRGYNFSFSALSQRPAFVLPSIEGNHLYFVPDA